MITRDRENDVLYAVKDEFLNKPVSHYCLTFDITIKIDYETKKFAGIILTDFSKLIHEDYKLMCRNKTIIL